MSSAGLALLLLSVAFAKEPKHEPLLLVAGMQKHLDIDFDTCAMTEECIRLGNKALAQLQYSRDKHQLIFSPIARGETTLTLRDEKGDIRRIYDIMVVDQNLPRFLDEIRGLLKNIKGIKAEIKGSFILIDGEAQSIQDLNRVYHAVSVDPYPKVSSCLVTLSDAGAKALARQIEKEIHTPGITVRPLNGLYVVEGEASSFEEVERIRAAAEITFGTLLVPDPNAKPLHGDIQAVKAKIASPVAMRVRIRENQGPKTTHKQD